MKALKAACKLYLYHIIILLAFFVLMGPLWFAMDRFPWFYSFFMLIVYGCTIYSVGWNYGKKDGRRIPGSYPNPAFPVKVSLLASVIPLCLFLLRVFFPSIWHIDIPFVNGEFDFLLTGNRLQGTTDFIFKIWYFPFGLFLGNGKMVTYFLAVLVLPVLVISGYFVGLRRFKLLDVLVEKLLYSTKKQK